MISGNLMFRMAQAIEPSLFDRLNIQPVFCFSFDRLTNIGGAVIRVNRDSDLAELDIGRVGNNFDLATLQAFIGSSGASVSKAYDGSGRNNHAVQTVKSYQPRIAENGVINTVNGKPTLTMTGGADPNTCQRLSLPNGMYAGMLSAALMGVFRQVSGNSGIDRITNSADGNHLSWNDNNGYVGGFSNNRYVFPGYYPTPNLTVHATVNTGTQLTVYKNSQIVPCSTIPTNDFTTTPTNNVLTAFYGTINSSEAIILNAAPTNAQRVALMSDRASYYGITF